MCVMKIVLLGDENEPVEKFFDQHCGQKIPGNSFEKRGVDFAILDMNHKGKNYKSQIWRMASDERFKEKRWVSYAGAHGGILFLSKELQQSHEIMDMYVEEIKTYSEGKYFPLVMIKTNKEEKNQEDGQKEKEELRKYALAIEKTPATVEVKVQFWEKEPEQEEEVKEIFAFIADNWRKYIERNEKNILDKIKI